MTKHHTTFSSFFCDSGELTPSSFDTDSVSVIMSLCSGVLQLEAVYVGNEL